MAIEKESLIPPPSVNHTVLVNSVVHLELLAVDWYDTATPFLGCVRTLQKLYDLTATTPLTIISSEIRYEISNQNDFREWVAKIFERGIEFGFHRQLT